MVVKHNIYFCVAACNQSLVEDRDVAFDVAGCRQTLIYINTEVNFHTYYPCLCCRRCRSGSSRFRLYFPDWRVHLGPSEAKGVYTVTLLVRFKFPIAFFRLLFFSELHFRVLPVSVRSEEHTSELQSR